MLTDPGAVADFAPLAERALSVDADAMIRFRSGAGTVGGFVRLPFEVLAGRTIEAVAGPGDLTVSARDFLSWLDDPSRPPPSRDAHWLSALPPRAGWQRIELVPDSAIREVIRAGAQLAQGTASRAGQQSLLEAIVLTAQSATRRVEVPLGPLSALTRMGFLPRDSQAGIDTVPGWLRIAAPLGSTFVATGNPLGLLSL
ncbi:MAG: hypothetical protein ACR2N4_02095 [Jatrophihabitans sp.]